MSTTSVALGNKPDTRPNTRSLSEKVRRRRNCLFRKADALAQLTDAEVYVLVAVRDSYYVYKSTGDKDFPPPEYEIVSLEVSTLVSLRADIGQGNQRVHGAPQRPQEFSEAEHFNPRRGRGEQRLTVARGSSVSPRYHWYSGLRASEPIGPPIHDREHARMGPWIRRRLWLFDDSTRRRSWDPGQRAHM